MDFVKDQTMFIFWLVIIIGAFIIGFFVNLFYNAMSYFGFNKTDGGKDATDD